MILKLISMNFHNFLLDSFEQVGFLEIFEAKVLHFVDLSYLSAQHIILGIWENVKFPN